MMQVSRSVLVDGDAKFIPMDDYLGPGVEIARFNGITYIGSENGNSPYKHLTGKYLAELTASLPSRTLGD